MSKRKGIVVRSGDVGVVTFAQAAYSFEITGENRPTTPRVAQPSVRYFDAEYEIPVALKINDKVIIVPNGSDNHFPEMIRKLILGNHLPGGVQKRQRNLLWGQGPGLYETAEDGFARTWKRDPEIEEWLNSFNYREVLRRSLVDYYMSEGVFSKYTLTNGAKVGKGKIHSVQHLHYHQVRLAWNPKKPENPTHAYTGEWNELKDFVKFPLFDRTEPWSKGNSIRYDSMYSFGNPFYGEPAWIGARSWIERGTDIPAVLAALSKNSLNVKWHIKSPSSYWEGKRMILQEQCQAQGKTYKEDMLEKLKDDTFAKLAEVLSGVENVGKFFTSETMVNEMGKMEEWTIEAIDQKVKDFITGQLEIAKSADSAITSGMGLHPSLSNIMVDGKLASGSEQLYAYKLYLATETAIPEEIVTNAINDAIALNWPEKKLKLGFYREIVKTEDSTTAGERIKNKV
jgi:hypothetical protein